jgi:hypothetical protein
VWRKKGKRYQEKNLFPTVKCESEKVMVLGYMAASGVGQIAFIGGIMDQYAYCRILSENIAVSVEKLEMESFIFQQDNDQKHCSKAVRAYFDTKNIMVLEWPSQSPDLNPIEYLWAHMKREIAKLKLQNKTALKEAIIRVWGAIPREVTQNLVYSMSRCVESVVRTQDRHTRY